MDTRDHLENLIQHYDLVIEANKDRESPLFDYIDFIGDLKECSTHLQRLKEIDFTATIEARTSADIPFHRKSVLKDVERNAHMDMCSQSQYLIRLVDADTARKKEQLELRQQEWKDLYGWK